MKALLFFSFAFGVFNGISVYINYREQRFLAEGY